MLSFKDLSAYQDTLQQYGIAGNDLAVFVDFKPVYRYMTGWQNVEAQQKITEHTMYKMYSMTKPVTVTAAMQLYERGLFMLDDKLSKYLPEFAEMKVYEKDAAGNVRIVDAAEPIRIRNLFEMTAGFDYVSDPEGRQQWVLKANAGGNLADFSKFIASRPLRFEPGTHWLYSVAHDVLAHLVEVLSGMTIGSYVKQNIFDPIGMADSTYHMTGKQEANLCLHYQLGPDGGLELVDHYNTLYCGPNFEGGGAGLVMTVNDYAKFTAMLANRGVAENGARILSGAAIDLIRTNRLKGVLLEDFVKAAQTRAGYGYGLGMRTMLDPAVNSGLSPVGEFGWGGVLGTYMAADPLNKVAIVHAMQTTKDGNRPRIQKTVRNLIYAALEYEKVL